MEAVVYRQRNRVMEAVAYLLAIAAAEVVNAVFAQPLWGIIAHIIILVTAIIRSARTGDKSQRQLVLSLALVPLVRIISLSMPLTDIPQIWWYPIIYVPLLVAAVVVIRILGYRRGEVGLSLKSLPIQLGVASTGLLFGWLEYYILRPEAMITQLTWSEVLPLALILLVCTGFVEEFIFRGVLQRSAVESFGWRGIIYISLLFATVHLIHYSEVGLTMVLIDIALVFAIAMFFGWVVKRTGSLLGVTLSHGITNIMLFLIIPFLF